MQRIIVCIKHVPDTGVPLRLNAGATGVEPADFVGIPNPPDLSAVELAVQIVDGFPGEVIVVSLGPAEAAATLRQGLALGATRGILISDPALEGADAYATAMVLATLVSSLHPRIVLCGARSLDGSAGLVGPALAEALGFVHIGRVTVVSVQGPESIVVERKLERGVRERVRCQLPALLTVDADVARPRNPSLPALLKALTDPIEVVDLPSLGIPAQSAGARLSLTRVAALSIARPRSRRVQGPPSALGAHERIQAILAGGRAGRRGSLHEGPPNMLAQEALEFLMRKGFLRRGNPGTQGDARQGSQVDP